VHIIQDQERKFHEGTSLLLQHLTFDWDVATLSDECLMCELMDTATFIFRTSL
jgi:hypothetical protein